MLDLDPSTVTKGASQPLPYVLGLKSRFYGVKWLHDIKWSLRAFLLMTLTVMIPNLPTIEYPKKHIMNGKKERTGNHTDLGSNSSHETDELCDLGERALFFRPCSDSCRDNAMLLWRLNEIMNAKWLSTQRVYHTGCLISGEGCFCYYRHLEDLWNGSDSKVEK